MLGNFAEGSAPAHTVYMVIAGAGPSLFFFLWVGQTWEPACLYAWAFRLGKKGERSEYFSNTVLIRSHFHFLPVKSYLIGNLGRKIYIHFNSKKLGTNFTYQKCM